ncbi:MAG: hypothetical protein NTX25_05290 [Proteobacteria bacterium]|nr:hypothetical protein [Pseudomonadota bacterium]
MFQTSQLAWMTELLGHDNLLVRRAVAETLGESAVQSIPVTQAVLSQLGNVGLAGSGWQRRDLEHLAYDQATLENCLSMARAFDKDRHRLAVELILLHAPALLLPIETELLHLPDLTRTEFELLKESIGSYRASSDTLWEKLSTMAAALTKYPMFPRRIKESVKALAREVARRPYPQNFELMNVLSADSNAWLKGLCCLILAARKYREASPLVLEVLLASDLAELNEFAEEALVSLDDESIIEQIIHEFPQRNHEYRVLTSSLFYRMPYKMTLQHAARLAEGEDDSVAYGLLLSYCRGFDQLGIERNYAIARSVSSSRELAFLGVESLGYAIALGIELPDRAHWMAEAQDIGLLNESEEPDEAVRADSSGTRLQGLGSAHWS